MWMEVSKRQVHLSGGAKRGRAENDMAALCAFSADVFTQQNNGEQALFGISRKQTHTARRKTWKHNRWNKRACTRTRTHKNKSVSTISITLTGLTVLPYSNKAKSRELSCCPLSYDNPQLGLYQRLQSIRFILVLWVHLFSKLVSCSGLQEPVPACTGKEVGDRLTHHRAHKHNHPHIFPAI